jgi:citrate lyase subunit beta/citryl-CoA lyase
MILRSMLFAPGDSRKKMDKAAASPADAVIFDLEDSVAPAAKPAARAAVAAYLKAHGDRSRQTLWVRINPLGTAEALPDLAAVVAGAPEGIILPKCNGAEDITLLGHYLDALEVQAGVAPGHVRIIPVATETARAFFTLGSYVQTGPRLAGLTWGAEDIATAIRAVTNTDETGALALTYQMARSFCLVGAHAAKVAALDTAYLDFRNIEALRAHAVARRREGFSGMLAIHPDQVPVINAAFSPSPEDIADAQRIVAAFAADPGKGAVGLDGKMIDLPHLRQARQLLALAQTLKK